MRRKLSWSPTPGQDAVYVGRHLATSRRERRVHIVAEASGGRMVVLAIGKKGSATRLTVKAENLRQISPGLFD